VVVACRAPAPKAVFEPPDVTAARALVPRPVLLLLPINVCVTVDPDAVNNDVPCALDAPVVMVMVDPVAEPLFPLIVVTGVTLLAIVIVLAVGVTVIPVPAVIVADPSWLVVAIVATEAIDPAFIPVIPLINALLRFWVPVPVPDPIRSTCDSAEVPVLFSKIFEDSDDA